MALAQGSRNGRRRPSLSVRPPREQEMSESLIMREGDAADVRDPACRHLRGGSQALAEFVQRGGLRCVDRIQIGMGPDLLFDVSGSFVINALAGIGAGELEVR
jgi:hypothetical protein